MNLARKIKQKRREKKYREIVRQLKLRHYEFEDESASKLQRSKALMQKIQKRILGVLQ